MLVAISSQQNGYSLCWALNNSLNIKLADAEDFRIEHENSKALFSTETSTQSFPSFFYEDDTNDTTYRLLFNKNIDGFLIHSLKNVDFLLVVDAPKDSIDKKKLIEDIKASKFTLMEFYIDTLKLKNKERKILEF